MRPDASRKKGRGETPDPLVIIAASHREATSEPALFRLCVHCNQGTGTPFCRNIS